MPNCDFGCYRFKSCYLPIVDNKKINFFNNKTIYTNELNNKFAKFTIKKTDIYENSKNLIRATFDVDNSKLAQILVNITINRHQFINKIKQLKIKQGFVINKNSYIKFFNFYRNYGNFFSSSEYNIIYLKNNNLNKINILRKKTIHFNLNLIKSQIFLSINKNFKNYVSWTISLGILLKSLRLKKNCRRTKIGFENLLKFLSKKIKKLMNSDYFFIISCKGHKKSVSLLLKWLLDIIPGKKMLGVIWLPKIPVSQQKKKRYASIKKNMKKRLLKLKNFY